MDKNLNLNENSEMVEALKEFEVKSSMEQLQKVQTFDKKISIAPGTSSLVQFVIKYSGGNIKNQRQAEYFVLFIVAIMILVTLYLFFGDSLKNRNSLPIEAFPDQTQFAQ